MGIKMIGLVATLAAATAVVVGGVQQPSTDPRAFVQRQYVHGVPYEQARALGSGAVDPLLQALADPSPAMNQWRPNVVVTLGYLGDLRAFSPLVSFLEKTEDAPDLFTFSAKLLVPLALGDIGRESANGRQQALAYLRDGAQRPFWTDRATWGFRSYIGARLWSQLAGACIHGLGRLASTDAEQTLAAIRKRMSSEDQLVHDVDSSLNVLKRLRTEGATKVFGSSSPGPGPAATGPLTGPVIPQLLTFSRHVDVPFWDATAYSRLSNATDLLSKKQGGCPTEVACPVRLSLSGSVTTHGHSGDALDIIDNQYEFYAVLKETANFKIVTLLRWCDRDGSRNGGFAGCTVLGQRKGVIVATAPGEVFAHEFGHAQGLKDRTNQACQKFIMDETAYSTDSVDAGECAAFRK